MALACSRVIELASGYVLGALDPEEMLDVKNHLRVCPNAHPEFDEFGGVVTYLAETLEPLEPPAWLRESVLAAARADLESRRRAQEPVAIPLATPSMAAAVPDVCGVSAKSGRVLSIARARNPRRHRALTWATRIAAAAALILLSGYSVSLQGDLDKAKKAQDEDASLNYMWAQPDTLKAVLTASDGSSASGMAALRPNGHILVRVHGLKPTQGDEVYAVWFGVGQATPGKVGTLTVDDSGSGYLEVDNVPTSANLRVFVSREPNASVTKPTGPTVVGGTIAL
jgi:anti-sigma factor RsiW